MKETLKATIQEAAQYLTEHGMKDPEVAIVLGSGLNGYADRIEDPIVIDYADIPNFTVGNSQGHRGQLVYGTHMGKKVILMAGRYHFYEGHSMWKTTFPTRVMIEMGIKRLIITNAAGCINTRFKVGQLMAISDHINLCGDNPLIADNIEDYGPRFPDMTYTYNPELRHKLIADAAKEGIEMAEGVYVMMSGPSFETPAEIRFLSKVGGDAVGMSTVPEAIVANQAKLEIIGITLLANMAAGVLDKPLSGADVNEASEKAAGEFSKVVDIAIGIDRESAESEYEKQRAKYKVEEN